MGQTSRDIPLMLMQAYLRNAKKHPLEWYAFFGWALLFFVIILLCLLAFAGSISLNWFEVILMGYVVVILLNVQFAEALIPQLPLSWHPSTRLIQAFFNENIAFVLATLLYFVKAKTHDKKSIYPPILCTHGYLHRSSAWLYIKAALEWQGISPLYTLDLKAPFSSIEDHAKTVQRKVKEIMTETGTHEIILLGHSMGGIVNTYFATNYADECGINVRKVVTIGSPLQGTIKAKNGRVASLEQMVYDPTNTFINQKIYQIIKITTNVQFLHIASLQDRIVQPYNSAIPFHDEELAHSRTKVIEGIGHLGLLYSPRVAQWIANFIKD